MENTKQIEVQKKNKNTASSSSSSSSSSSTSSSIAKRLWRIARVIYYMLRKATCKRSKLMLDLNLIMQRSKLAGKAITHLLTFNHNHHHHHHRSLPCFYMDPMMSYYNPNPREVEFSCSNTPSNSKSYKHGKHHHHNHYNHHQLYDAEAIAKVFEILNDVEDDHGDQSLISSPSPLMMLGQVRQLRITDSPFPVREEESDGFRIDLEAEEFIRRFYEQLRLQPTSTPEYFSSHRRSPLLARA